MSMLFIELSNTSFTRDRHVLLDYMLNYMSPISIFFPTV